MAVVYTDAVLVGPQGPQGPPGAPGGATYTHVQATPAASWSITHGLARRPSVTVVDSAGTVVIGGVAYTSDDTVTITFSGAFSGAAYLN